MALKKLKIHSCIRTPRQRREPGSRNAEHDSWIRIALRGFRETERRRCPTRSVESLPDPGTGSDDVVIVGGGFGGILRAETAPRPVPWSPPRRSRWRVIARPKAASPPSRGRRFDRYPARTHRRRRGTSTATSPSHRREAPARIEILSHGVPFDRARRAVSALGATCPLARPHRASASDRAREIMAALIAAVRKPPTSAGSGRVMPIARHGRYCHRHRARPAGRNTRADPLPARDVVLASADSAGLRGTTIRARRKDGARRFGARRRGDRRRRFVQSIDALEVAAILPRSQPRRCAARARSS